jgi:preprotein translocase subunit SecG
MSFVDVTDTSPITNASNALSSAGIGDIITNTTGSVFGDSGKLFDLKQIIAGGFFAVLITAILLKFAKAKKHKRSK